MERGADNSTPFLLLEDGPGVSDGHAVAVAALHETYPAQETEPLRLGLGLPGKNKRKKAYAKSADIFTDLKNRRRNNDLSKMRRS